MKAAVYYSQSDLHIEEKPKPIIGDDEALVEMKACGLCGSDLMDWYLKSRAPLVLGHEPSGIIVETGKNVKNFTEEDRVFVHHHVADLSCYYCRRGDYTLCEQFHKTNIDPGGFAQYFRVPAPNLRLDTLKIPDAVSFEEATLIEPIGCCLRALNKCHIQRGETVTVVGTGATGVIHVVLARIMGAKQIIASDLFDSRLAMAEKFGADVTVNAEKENLAEAVKTETNGIGSDVVVVSAPNIKAYELGLSACRKGGKLVVFAPSVPEAYLKVSPKELFFTEVQIIPSYSTSHIETRQALELIESRRFDARGLITHRFRLHETAKAFEAALNDRTALKIVILNE